MKIVSWNCRGLGGVLKVEEIKNMLKSEKPDILLIQKTKMTEEEVLDISNLLWKEISGMAFSSKGASGGIATFCSPSNFIIRLI
jgi:exonuclease III